TSVMSESLIGTNRIESWKKEAIALSHSDPIGSVLCGALELLLHLAKNGQNCQDLNFALKALEIERNQAISDDPEKHLLLRAVVYGLCESLAIAVHTLSGTLESQFPLNSPKQEDFVDGSINEIDADPANVGHIAVPFTVSFQPMPRADSSHNGENALVQPKIEEIENIVMAVVDIKEEEPDPESEPSESNSTRMQHYSNDDLYGGASTSAVCAAPSTEESLRLQTRKSAEAVAPTFNCDQCRRTFRSLQQLATHKHTHALSNDRPFECNLCDKNFSLEKHLSRHVREYDHSKLQRRREAMKKLPFKCDQCDRSFERDSRLQAHRRTHTGERPFVCPQCNLAFFDVNRLKYHLRTVVHSEKESSE
ncbi:hypothetical protein PFISCL1PPCAC_11106, partial [Pristionchus fissidentatus]